MCIVVDIVESQRACRATRAAVLSSNHHRPRPQLSSSLKNVNASCHVEYLARWAGWMGMTRPREAPIRVSRSTCPKIGQKNANFFDILVMKYAKTGKGSHNLSYLSRFVTLNSRLSKLADRAPAVFPLIIIIWKTFYCAVNYYVSRFQHILIWCWQWEVNHHAKILERKPIETVEV